MHQPEEVETEKLVERETNWSRYLYGLLTPPDDVSNPYSIRRGGGGVEWGGDPCGAHLRVERGVACTAPELSTGMAD